jgi:hypothetical protein
LSGARALTVIVAPSAPVTPFSSTWIPGTIASIVFEAESGWATPSTLYFASCGVTESTKPNCAAAVPVTEIVFAAPVVREATSSCPLTTDAFTGVPDVALIAAATASTDAPASIATSTAAPPPTWKVSVPAAALAGGVTDCFCAARASWETSIFHEPPGGPPVFVTPSFDESLDVTVCVSVHVPTSRRPCAFDWRFFSRVSTSRRAV